MTAQRILLINEDGTAEVNGVKVPMVPVEPTPELLRSMAIRRDHGLGVPGYYDNAIFAHSGMASHRQRMDSAMRDMRQLHEEVVGTEFYAAAIDLSSLPRVPERKTSSGIAYTSAYDIGYFDGHPDGFNSALDAMGIK